MTILEPDKGGNAAEITQEVATPACWQCESYVEDWPNRNQGVCATLGDRMRRMGLPVVGNVTVAQDGDEARAVPPDAAGAGPGAAVVAALAADVSRRITTRRLALGLNDRYDGTVYS